ncbi:MAG: hypothetical protein H6736_14540 [Alphaproteobacteria bacterium]|nr:hypothetical protein [Alphaproteobacteria bacterium]
MAFAWLRSRSAEKEQVPVPERNPRREAAVQQDAAPAKEEPGYLDQLAKEDRTPVFPGFEDERYQAHDARIEDLVSQFNLDKAGFVGATEDQAEGIGDLDPAMVKAWLIQETGGGDRRSRAAWDTDPGQVNVPGDWSAQKGDDQMDLSKPKKRNEGDIDGNLKAAIVWLTRKGFSRSGRAPADLEGGQSFGGWEKALENYNGRGEKTRNGKRYRENYADRILARAGDTDTHAPIQLPK